MSLLASISRSAEGYAWGVDEDVTTPSVPSPYAELDTILSRYDGHVLFSIATDNDDWFTVSEDDVASPKEPEALYGLDSWDF